LVGDGGVVGGEDLEDVVAAAVQVPDLVIGPVGDQCRQFRRIEEVLADIGAVLGLEGLILAVAQFHHALFQNALLVAGEQRIPVGAPDQLDDVPAGTAEFGFELLDDLAVAAHRAVQTLQVAVDDENQVVELFAAGHADGAQRFDLVGLAVAQEGPNLALLGLGGVDQATRGEVLHEAGLVDGLDRAETHGDGRELPEVRHQPGVRIRRNALAAGFLAEVVHLLCGQTAEHEGAGIDAGYRVALEEDQVAAGVMVDALPEMREADVVEGGGRGEGSDVAADVGVLVGAHDHGHGVPADIGVNLDFEVGVAGVFGLAVDRDGVDVFGVGRVGDVDPVFAGLTDQFLDQVMGAFGAFLSDDAIEGISPFLGFLRIYVGGVRQGVRLVGHGLSPRLVFILFCLLSKTTLTLSGVQLVNPDPEISLTSIFT